MAHEQIPEAEALLDKEFKVLDHGFVRLIDYMGSDQAIVRAARVSYGKDTRKISEDRALIRYLIRHRHTSPFEMVEMKFHVKLPIFVARQWIRHRTANVNEYSGRYSVMRDEFYLPKPEHIKFQATDNKQGRSDKDIPDDLKEQLIAYFRDSQREAYDNYQKFIDDGLARELARINLPLSLYTEWYWKIDLHNLFHFLKLRADCHAQYEIREYANVMARMVETVCPVAYEAFVDYTLNSQCFSGPELQALAHFLSDFPSDVDTLVTQGLSKREARELIAKINSIRDFG
jgi:thymidylate synthase (FAD)